MGKKIYLDRFYIKPDTKQIVYGHEDHYYDVTNDVIQAMFHYPYFDRAVLYMNDNSGKDEKDPVKVFKIDNEDGFTLAIYPTPEENEDEWRW